MQCNAMHRNVMSPHVMSWHVRMYMLIYVHTYIFVHLFGVIFYAFFGAFRYLGEALLSLLCAVGLQAQGLDLMAKEPGSIAGDVSAEETVQRAAEGCRPSAIAEVGESVKSSIGF